MFWTIVGALLFVSFLPLILLLMVGFGIISIGGVLAILNKTLPVIIGVFSKLIHFIKLFLSLTISAIIFLFMIAIALMVVYGMGASLYYGSKVGIQGFLIALGGNILLILLVVLGIKLIYRFGKN